MGRLKQLMERQNGKTRGEMSSVKKNSIKQHNKLRRGK